MVEKQQSDDKTKQLEELTQNTSNISWASSCDSHITLMEDAIKISCACAEIIVSGEGVSIKSELDMLVHSKKSINIKSKKISFEAKNEIECSKNIEELDSKFRLGKKGIELSAKVNEIGFKE